MTGRDRTNEDHIMALGLYWKKRAEKAEAIVRDIASSGCECAAAVIAAVRDFLEGWDAGSEER